MRTGLRTKTPSRSYQTYSRTKLRYASPPGPVTANRSASLNTYRRRTIRSSPPRASTRCMRRSISDCSPPSCAAPGTAAAAANAAHAKANPANHRPPRASRTFMIPPPDDRSPKGVFFYLMAIRALVHRTCLFPDLSRSRGDRRPGAAEVRDRRQEEAPIPPRSMRRRGLPGVRREPPRAVTMEAACRPGSGRRLRERGRGSSCVPRPGRGPTRRPPPSDRTCRPPTRNGRARAPTAQRRRRSIRLAARSRCRTRRPLSTVAGSTAQLQAATGAQAARNRALTGTL